MKNLSVILSSLALLGVIILFGMQMSGDDSKGKEADTAKEEKATTGKIAYINIDSLEANYEYLKKKQKELETRQENMANELKRSQQKFQEDYLAVQRKAQAGTLTQAEYEAAEKRLRQMSQSLESSEARLTNELMKEQEEFNKDLKKRLDDYLSDYNKDKGYDFILSYSSMINNILHADSALEITEDIIRGMNEEYAKENKGKDSKKDKKDDK